MIIESPRQHAVKGQAMHKQLGACWSIPQHKPSQSLKSIKQA